MRVFFERDDHQYQNNAYESGKNLKSSKLRSCSYKLFSYNPAAGRGFAPAGGRTGGRFGSVQ